MARLLQKDDWVVYAAFLPALLASSGIAATATTAWHAQKAWHLPRENAACIHADTDDYVRGLAKRGIATLPGYDLPATEKLRIPAAAIAASELRARREC